jgi:integrase
LCNRIRAITSGNFCLYAWQFVKPRKRTNADGSEVWVVRWREAGRGSTNRSKTFRREGDAKRFATAVQRGKDLGQLASEVVGSEQTFRAFVVEWWEKYAVANLKPGTRATYKYVLSRWLVRYLGELRLRDLTREAVDTYVASALAAGAGRPTVNRSLGILQGIMRRAVEWHRIPTNPVAGVRRLEHRRSVSIDAKTPEQVEAIRARLATGYPLASQTLVSLLAYEGLRPSEAVALDWADVLDAKGKPRDRLRVHGTKTRRALREVELFKPIARELAELYLAHGRPGLDTPVFVDERGRRLDFRRWRGGTKPDRKTGEPVKWGTWVKVADFRPYDLRHTCATLLIYESRPPTELAEHLGHADPGFTMRVYGHVYRDSGKRRRQPVADAITTARKAARGEKAG